LLQPVMATWALAKKRGLSDQKKLRSLPQQAAPVVFTNVRVFDGKSDKLHTGLRVRVEGETIKAIEPAEHPAITGAVTVCTLMPGLIDALWHAMFAPFHFPSS